MLDGTEDEEKFLAAGIAGLQQNSFYMHRALVTSPINPNFNLSSSILLAIILISDSSYNFQFSIDLDPFSDFPFSDSLQDSNNLRDALKYSAQMLSELRTSKLSPHKYYELCEFLFSDPPLLDCEIDSVLLLLRLFICKLNSLCGFLDMRAFDQLRKLEMFFEEETRRGCSIIDLYELVQHAGNILPRL
jgi:vacuolar protein sorting-associated protein 35